MSRYPVKFKAAILEKVGKPLKVDEVEFKGPLEEGQVFVKLCYSGICGKQIDEMEGKAEDPFIPHMLGHEGSAEVLDIGPKVTKVKKGDFVVLHWMKGKGIHAKTPLYYRNGKRVNAGWVTTFNEYAVVSENRLTKITKDTDMLIASLMGCVVTTGVGAVNHVAKISAGDRVVVYGCGGVGLTAIQAAVLKKPEKLIAIDIKKQALVMAKEFGATDIIDSFKENAVNKVKSLTNGKGADKVLVCIGNTKAIEEGIQMTSIPGNTYIVGVPPQKENIKVNAHAVMHERNIIGTLGGGSLPDLDIPVCFDMYRKGQLKIDRLVSHVGPFKEINTIISQMMGKTPGRCVVKFN